jgi:UDP-N-acetyl-D-mannosaminuronate dehydrogenase
MENITIIGIGNIGLGLALLIEKANYNVIGVDINTNYIEKLNSKTFFHMNHFIMTT